MGNDQALSQIDSLASRLSRRDFRFNREDASLSEGSVINDPFRRFASYAIRAKISGDEEQSEKIKQTRRYFDARARRSS
jgi:hypothetical protein